jgi:folylpolyglutamate synthase/dihydropteroate synthase
MEAMNKTQNKQSIVVFGSNYIVGEAIEFLEKKNEKTS